MKRPSVLKRGREAITLIIAVAMASLAFASSASASPQPTQLSTELTTETQSGNSLTVSDETAVTDTAILSGPNAATATGIVTYTVYSDNDDTPPECTPEDEFGENEEVPVQSHGTVPPSRPLTLPPGLYYYQASYSGDANNASSTSACGSEVEQVEEPQTCSKLDGNAHVGIGLERESTDNNVNTGLTGKQVFSFNWGGGAGHVHVWHLKSASCVVLDGEKTFTGRGVAKERSKKGYEIEFSVSIGREGRVYITVVVLKEKVVLEEVVHKEFFKGKELIS